MFVFKTRGYITKKNPINVVSVKEHLVRMEHLLDIGSSTVEKNLISILNVESLQLAFNPYELSPKAH